MSDAGIQQRSVDRVTAEDLAGRRRSFTRRVLAIFLPLAALILLLTLFLYRSEGAKEMIVARAGEMLGVRMGDDAMRSHLDTIAKDLRYLSGNQALVDAINASKRKALDHLAGDFAQFLLAMKVYDKVRWIDETGKERVRVNFTGRKTVIVREQDLQNKADRYYFSDISRLKADEVYISPFDLNMEHGRVEMPRKPVIRFGMQLFTRSGRSRGILILTCQGQQILDEFVRATRSIEGRVMLLNNEGYWIKSPVAEDEWGFMFGKQDTFVTRHPDAWNRIGSEESGQFEAEGGIWTFSTVHPRTEAGAWGFDHENIRAAASAAGRDEYMWKVVSFLPADAGMLLDRKRMFRLALTTIVLLGVVLFGSWKMAAAWTRQKQAENEQRHLAERLSLLMDSLGEGVFVIDAAGTCSYINPAALAILGYRKDDVIGKDAHGLFLHQQEDGGPSHAEACPLVQAASGGEAWSGEDQFFRKNGPLVRVQVIATPVRKNGIVMGAVVVFQDITERIQLEERLRQSQKLEAVGTLAGGVAHDFNNILTVITGHAELLRMSLGAGDPLSEDVRQIIESGDRAKKISQRLLAFSRKQVMATAPIDLVVMIASFEPFLRRLLTEDVELRLCLPERELVVLADRVQLEQGLMNIVANASDALPAGGKIVISAGEAALDESFILRTGYRAPGRCAFVSVKDSGAGMDEATRQRIFEPFFTTKEVGKGTGLGLAMVFGIVEQLKGYVDVASAKGEGTTVTIYLPLVPGASGEEAPSSAPRSFHG